MATESRYPLVARIALYGGAVALLVTGADHLEEYTVGQFSPLPTIGTLFLLNFIAATLVAVCLVLPFRRFAGRFADALVGSLATIGIAIAASSLAGLLVSESSGLFGFMDHGYRPAIVIAIAAEIAAIMLLSAFLALAGLRLPRSDLSEHAH
jgi:hypothetical protein